MRIEVVVEKDDREFRSVIECDQGVEWDIALQAAIGAVDRVIGNYRLSETGLPGRFKA